VPTYAAAPERQDFVETVRKLWRHRRLILLCTGAAGALSVLLATSLASHYVAEARVLVGIPVPKVLTGQAILTDEVADAERVQSESFVIQSRDLARQVIDKLHLQDNPEFNPYLPQQRSWLEYLSPSYYLGSGLFSWLHGSKPKAGPSDPSRVAERHEDRMVDVFLNKVDAATLGRSHVLSVQASAGDPDVAAQIANALAQAYIDHQRAMKVATTKEVAQRLQEHIAELRQQAEKSDQAVEDYRRKYGLYKVGQLGVTNQELGELNTQLVIAQTNKAEAEARLRDAENLRRTGASAGMNADSVPEVLRSPTIQNLKQQQAEAERQMAELSASYGPRHPKIINARAQIADIRHKIQLEVARIVDGLRHEVRTADARYEALKENFDRLKNQMGGANEKSIQLEALERDAKVNHNLLEAMLTRAKQAVGEEAFQQSDAQLISRAAAPGAPSYPPKGLIVFLGTLAGTLVGGIMAMLKEGVDRTFRRSDQIESATGLPVLAMLPTLRGGTPATVHVLRKPISPFSEALRKLYIGLELSEAARSPKTILFCSATPGEGKSVMVASLGRLLASNGKRIMLIDCDWRLPNLHRLFHCPNRGGLASLLSDDKAGLSDIVYNDALSGLDVIVAGDLNPKSVPLLTSERMRLILQALAKNYDFVLIDTPPVHVGAEVLHLARMVDKTVFAIRWGYTPREVSLDALKQIIEAQGDVAGVVLSRVDTKRYKQYAYGNLNYEYTRPALARLG
jgi:capsular exopolysaccharide synthesis family protein